MSHNDYGEEQVNDLADWPARARLDPPQPLVWLVWQGWWARNSSACPLAIPQKHTVPLEGSVLAASEASKPGAPMNVVMQPMTTPGVVEMPQLPSALVSENDKTGGTKGVSVHQWLTDMPDSAKTQACCSAKCETACQAQVLGHAQLTGSAHPPAKSLPSLQASPGAPAWQLAVGRYREPGCTVWGVITGVSFIGGVPLQVRGGTGGPPMSTHVHQTPHVTTPL